MGRLNAFLEQGALKRWTRAASDIDDMDPVSVRALKMRARALSTQLAQVMQAADARLAPRGKMARPMHADWAWRPEMWSGPVQPAGMISGDSGARFGREAKFFHDCTHAAFSARQRRASGREATAPFEVEVDVYQFAGSFLSLALDVPHLALERLDQQKLVRLNLHHWSERPVAVYGRLNLRHGPNVAQVVRRFAGDDWVDLDLAAVDVDEDQVSGAWVDLIFEAPAMNRIVLRDVTMSRRPRAAY